LLRPLGTLDPWALSYRSWKKAPYFRLIERRNLSGASAIHATTPLEEAAIRAQGLSARVAVIPLGIEIGEPIPRPHDATGDEPLDVLYLSRLHPIKGLDLFIDALQRLEDTRPFRVTLAGDGEARYVRWLKDEVERRGLTRRVHFAGFVAGEEKARLLERADIFVLPSYSENFGVAMAEAMAASIPVVVTDRVGLGAAVEQAGAGLVVPPEAAALAAALRELLEDGAQRRRMGAAGRAYVEKELTWPRVARQLVQLYEDIVLTHER
jgi:glycosyltransferase involved in cell wall biosynthesis